MMSKNKSIRSTKIKVAEVLISVIAGIICGFVSSAIVSKIVGKTSVLPNIVVFLLFILVLTTVFGEITEKYSSRIFGSCIQKAHEIALLNCGKGEKFSDETEEETEKLSLNTIDEIIDTKTTKYYLQSGIVFTIFSSILANVSTNIDLLSLWFLLFFELFFASLIFVLVACVDARKIIYPIEYSGGGVGIYMQIQNFYKAKKMDIVLTNIMKHAFHAWLLITLLIYLIV